MLTTETTQYLSVRFTIFTDSEVIDGLSIHEQNELCGFCVEEPWELDEKVKEMANSFQGRLLQKLRERSTLEKSREEEETRAMVESRRSRLIEEGIVTEEEAREFISQPFGVLPPNIQQRRYERMATEREENRLKLQEKNIDEAAKVYKDAWVLRMEQEIHQLCLKRKMSCDDEMRSSLDHLLEINENKLKQFHELRGTMTREALEERKKLCLSLGYVEPDMAHQIENVYQRMPDVVNTACPLELTPPRSDIGEDIPIPPTPSWTPKPNSLQPFRTPWWGTPDRLIPSQSAATPMGSPELVPPKTPSWSPKSQPATRYHDYEDDQFVIPSTGAKKRQTRIKATPIKKRKQGKNPITNYFSSQK